MVLKNALRYQRIAAAEGLTTDGRTEGARKTTQLSRTRPIADQILARRVVEIVGRRVTRSGSSELT